METITVFYSRCHRISSLRIKLLIVKDVSAEKCNQVIELIRRKQQEVLVVLCGGLHECHYIYTMPGNIVGINYIGDDIYEIKALKNRNGYIPGRWIKLGKICIGGLDALNHKQNLERLVKNILLDCDAYLVISAYPPKESRCSSIEILGKKLSIGIENLLEELRSVLNDSILIVISCHRAIESFCIDRHDNVMHVSLSKEPLIELDVIIENNEVNIHKYSVKY